MRNLDEPNDAILITGPTASGKSALALRLARECGGVVVNADSMQVYDTLQVLTARPAEHEMEGIAHHLYGHVPAKSLYSTGEWLRDMEGLLVQLRAAGQRPVIVGGTGLYFKALTGGLSDMPAVAPEIRMRLRQRLIDEGSHALHSDLASRDRVSADALRPSDGQRIVRALEVLEATGRSIRAFQGARGPMLVDPDQAKKYVVLPSREVLHQRINRRFEAMMESGAVEEVEALLRLKLAEDATAMKAIGVVQIARLLRGEIDRAEAIATSAAATRQYAKRQMTWFRNQMDESWQRIVA